MINMPIDQRVLTVEHEHFGILNEDRTMYMFTNYKGQTFVAGYWGRWDIFANLPAEEVMIIESWYCVWPMGYNTDCGYNAYQVRDGYPYCDAHAISYDMMD